MRRCRGITALEVIGALAILGVTLILATSLDSRGPRASERLAAQRVALRAAEAALEAVRAGALPPVSGPVVVPGSLGQTRGLRVRLEVGPAGRPGLVQVRARATARAPGAPVTQTLATLVWRGR